MNVRTVVVGLTVLTLAGAAACTSDPAAAPPGPSAPGGSTAVAGMVRRACAGAPPKAVSAAIPGATGSFTPTDKDGVSCSWIAADATTARHVLALAVTNDSFDNWLHLYPGATMTGHTSVAGYAAVSGPAADGCTILVNVEGKALEIDLSGVPDPSCAATTQVAGQLVATR